MFQYRKDQPMEEQINKLVIVPGVLCSKEIFYGNDHVLTINIVEYTFTLICKRNIPYDILLVIDKIAELLRALNFTEV